MQSGRGGRMLRGVLAEQGFHGGVTTAASTFQLNGRSTYDQYLEGLPHRSRPGIGREVRPNDFLPRRLLSDYLAWAADRILAALDVVLSTSVPS